LQGSREITVIEQIMRRDFVCGDPDESLESARQTMRMGDLRHLLVAEQGRLVGILSYRDVLERLLAGAPRRAASGSVEDLMTRAPSFVTPGAPLADAADRLCRFGFGCLPVLEAPAGGSAEAGRLVGIVTERDLLRAAYRLRSP
jgi:CBS domain-containing protein